MPVRQITIQWSASATQGGTSVLHFLDTFPVATQRTALGVCLNAIKGLLAPGTQATVATTGREFDTATGTLVGAWTDNTAQSTVGTGAVPSVPNASQALVRLNTGVIQNGRFVQGKIFIPGLSYNNLVTGELNGGAITTMSNAWATCAAASDMIVWHRPVNNAGGTAIDVAQVTTWNELAVLRRRR